MFSNLPSLFLTFSSTTVPIHHCLPFFFLSRDSVPSQNRICALFDYFNQPNQFEVAYTYIWSNGFVINCSVYARFFCINLSWNGTIRHFKLLHVRNVGQKRAKSYGILPSARRRTLWRTRQTIQDILRLNQKCIDVCNHIKPPQLMT